MGLITGYPVASFPIKFTWQSEWFEVFERQTALVQRDLERARAGGRLAIYLSCPISARGGGEPITNVDIAAFTERRLMEELGERFWILNPSRYQLESAEGRATLSVHLDAFMATGKATPASGPAGGDYMRMWTRVLVEDDDGRNCGRRIDSFYFLGPRDVEAFCKQGKSGSLTACIEEYFSRKVTTDLDFRRNFEPPFMDEKGVPITDPTLEAEVWRSRRRSFLRYYSLRASAAFSKGSHDEWNILQRLNGRRELGDQISCFFDGLQVSMAAGEAPVSPGYESS